MWSSPLLARAHLCQCATCFSLFLASEESVKYAPVIPNPQLQPLLDIDDFCRLTGTSRTKTYKLAKADKLPVPVVRIGSSYRLPTAKLLVALGLSETA